MLKNICKDSNHWAVTGWNTEDIQLVETSFKILDCAAGASSLLPI